VEENVADPFQKAVNTAVGIRHTDHVAPISQKLQLTSPTSGCRSIGIVSSRAQATEFSFFNLEYNISGETKDFTNLFGFFLEEYTLIGGNLTEVTIYELRTEQRTHTDQWCQIQSYLRP
jgi:hypothetical protein